MTAALALMANERGDVRFVQQSMYYPVTDAAMDTGSYEQFAEGYFLAAKGMAWFWDAYLPDLERRSEPYASPLRASDEQLAGLPPAFVIVDEADVLRDEGEAYAARLRAAGVAVTTVRYDGITHDFMMLNPLSDTRRRAPQSPRPSRSCATRCGGSDGAAPCRARSARPSLQGSQSGDGRSCFMRWFGQQKSARRLLLPSCRAPHRQHHTSIGAPERVCQLESSTTTGISRIPLVCSSYPANDGQSLFCCSQIISRSWPSATCARAANIWVPISTETSGFATTLKYQSGFAGDPPFEANTATLSPETR